MFQLCFNLNRIHDSVGKALRTGNQGDVTANSHALSTSLHPSFARSVWVERNSCNMNDIQLHEKYKQNLDVLSERYFVCIYIPVLSCVLCV